MFCMLRYNSRTHAEIAQVEEHMKQYKIWKGLMHLMSTDCYEVELIFISLLFYYYYYYFHFSYYSYNLSLLDHHGVGVIHC